MMSLEGAAAFSALADALAGRADPDAFRLADPALERLRAALRDPEASDMDLALLLRHALVGETERRGGGARALLPRPQELRGDDGALRAAGVEIVAGESLRALDWRPDWLSAAESPPDANAARAARRRFGDGDLGPEADPFIRPLGHARYRSVGQRAAVRAALLTPAGRSTAIDLPTGEGKSLVFRAIDRVGFASSSANSTGVTLVVVPTVALAFDHENACRTGPTELLAYVGGDPDRRAKIVERLETAQTGLVFAAPEAACGSLRRPLLALARAGRLKAIVVDEAHLVDAWGTGFRPEFQSLSGLRSELLESAPAESAPRTILLSATITPETLDTLEVLFASPDGLPLLSAAQVRPEPDYYVVPPADDHMRRRSVEDALLHAPRPVILYVTEVAEAVRWAERLPQMGFRRFAAFHGKTSDVDREQTLKAWREGRLDLVVATSAFGLGIDYPHVRTVLHACVPETFDRFYQEVGRGGRDGCACLSLALPGHSDFRVARGLNRERVITVKRGLERWSAMFHHADRRHLGGMRFRVRLDVAPGTGVDDIDLVGERSLQWNARVLTLMARSGLLRLVGGVAPEEGEVGVFETVELLDDGHLQRATWERLVEPTRREIARARARNLDLMLEHLRGHRCPSDLVEELYGRDRIVPGCSRCVLCREDSACAKPNPLRQEPPSPWPAPAARSPLSEFLVDGQVVVTYSHGEPSAFNIRRAAAAFASLWSAGARLLRLVGTPPPLFDRAMQGLEEVPVFVSRAASRAASRLPSGLEVVLVGDYPGFRLGTVAPRDARLVLLPADQPDPDRPGEALLDRYNGACLSLEALLEKLAT